MKTNNLNALNVDGLEGAQNMNSSQLSRDLEVDLKKFMQSLRREKSIGRFLPCARGYTEAGQKISLGFSCFALKIYYMLGWWDELESGDKKTWIQYLKSYQHLNQKSNTNPRMQNGIYDQALTKYLKLSTPWFQRWWLRLTKPKQLTPVERVVIAETKQTIATLVQVGESSDVAYAGYPQTTEELEIYLNHLDWTKPWGAGGQASALAVFYATEAPRAISEKKAAELRQCLANFFTSLANPKCGGYFKGERPAFGQLINGAMKVLTGLDWLDASIHYPKKLIDSCLKQSPDPSGCNLVDWIYVVYRCGLVTDYRQDEIRQACRQVVKMIQLHHCSDGGFSYRVGKSRPNYYGIRVTQKLAEGDIHATCLLTWALAMLDYILSLNLGWKVIKP